MRVKALAVVGSLFLSLLTDSSVAQDQAEPEQSAKTKTNKAKPVAKAQGSQKVVGSWIVTCGPKEANPGNCSAQLQMIDQKKKVALLTMVVGFGTKGSLLLEVVTPTGVLIEPGVQMKIGAVEGRSPYIGCGPLGCSSRYIIDGKTLTALKKAKQADFSIVTQTRQIAKITVNPQGTAQMLAELGL